MATLSHQNLIKPCDIFPLAASPIQNPHSRCNLLFQACHNRPLARTMRNRSPHFQFAFSGEKNGAGDQARTDDFDLGKVALYQLSYTRPE